MVPTSGEMLVAPDDSNALATLKSRAKHPLNCSRATRTIPMKIDFFAGFVTRNWLETHRLLPLITVSVDKREEKFGETLTIDHWTVERLLARLKSEESCWKSLSTLSDEQKNSRFAAESGSSGSNRRNFDINATTGDSWPLMLPTHNKNSLNNCNQQPLKLSNSAQCYNLQKSATLTFSSFSASST